MRSKRASVAAVAADGYDFSCGRHEYLGFPRTLQDWTECEETCLGLGAPKFHFAEIEDQAEWECVKANLLSYYIADNSNDKPAWHFWLAGERQLDGSYGWISGRPMTVTDFVGNPGDDPYLHITPGNQYLWNTKRQEDDTNNGCLCYRENFYNKKRLI